MVGHQHIVQFPTSATPGHYKLRVKSRDLFGNESELLAVGFQGHSPYWKNRHGFTGLNLFSSAVLVFLSPQAERGQ